MQRDRTVPLFLLLLLAPLLAGCAAPRGEGEPAPEWSIGDLRVYRKEGTESGYFTRHVSGLISIDGQEAHEVLETRTYSPLVSRSYWALGSLRLLRQDFLEQGHLVGQEVYRGDSSVFYHFPLAEERDARGTFTVETRRGSFAQQQEAAWRLEVDPPTELRVAGKVWQTIPYRIEHSFPGPSNWQRVAGWYAPALGDYVLLVTEGPDYRNTYSLVQFREAHPRPGLPLYGLAAGSAPVEVPGPMRLTAEAEAVHAYFYTRLPRTLDVRVTEARSFDPDRGVVWVTLRPAGALGAALGELPSLGSSSLGLLYAAVSGERVDGGRDVLVDRNGERVLLLPGQIYEVTLASNVGSVTLELGSPGEATELAGARHGFQALEAESREKGRRAAPEDPAGIAAPGPQRVEETERITLLPGASGRVETLVVHRVLPVEQPVPDLGRVERVGATGDAGSVSGREVFYAEWREANAERVQLRSSYVYEADISVDGRYARHFTVVSMYMAESP